MRCGKEVLRGLEEGYGFLEQAASEIKGRFRRLAGVNRVHERCRGRGISRVR